MPIRPENKGKYPPDWRAITARIRERAGNVCEWCGAPNGQVIVRVKGYGIWSPTEDALLSDLPADHARVADWDGTWRDEKGQRVRVCDLPPLGRADVDEDTGEANPYSRCTLTRVILTVAHLDHALTDHSDANLAALCQRCHLGYDMATHIANARETRQRKAAAIPLPLFAEPAP